MEISAIIKEFEKRFGKGGEIRIFKSPGRVNLIGEHTDYNGGCVFPAAICLETTIAARVRKDRRIRMAATDLDVLVDADIDKIEDYKDLKWGNYQLGIASELMKDGYDVQGCDMLFDDTTPHGGGLSSSAAIEVATALCLGSHKPESGTQLYRRKLRNYGSVCICNGQKRPCHFLKLRRPFIQACAA